MTLSSSGYSTSQALPLPCCASAYPKEVVRLLVDEPPELIPGSFVSRRLRGYRTDRLYRTHTLTGKPVLIHCLIEHKSRPETRTPLQLLGYLYQYLDHWNRTEGKNPDGSWRPLPAIVPMVVYHGAEKWTAPLSLFDTTNSDPALRPYLLDFRYNLVDLGRIPAAELSQKQELRVGFLILKHGNLNRTTREKLRTLISEAERLGDDDLATLIYYLMGDLDEPQSNLVREILNELLPEKEAHMLSVAAQKWLAEGEAKGKAEGKAEGKADSFLRLLERRFRVVPDEIRQRIPKTDLSTLDTWFDRAIDAPSLDQVFSDQPEPNVAR